uniref:Uncharacterized protein n=1 Tax=Nothoprocta perdicaria TaxID=30464 RepID=A0A8C6Z282_NOTPE
MSHGAWKRSGNCRLHRQTVGVWWPTSHRQAGCCQSRGPHLAEMGFAGPAPSSSAQAGAAVLSLQIQPFYIFFFYLFQKEDAANEEMAERLSLRKHRFMHFASLEYEGEHYMTPRDFLFSVMFDQVERKFFSHCCICEGTEI